MKTLKLYLTPPHGLLFLANFTFLLSFFFVPKNANGQTLINQLWTQTLNYPDTVPWSASVLNSSSDLFTAGNTWHNATQKVNIVTTKTNSSGTIIWQTEYDGDGDSIVVTMTVLTHVMHTFVGRLACHVFSIIMLSPRNLQITHTPFTACNCLTSLTLNEVAA